MKSENYVEFVEDTPVAPIEQAVEAIVQEFKREGKLPEDVEVFVHPETGIAHISLLDAEGIIDSMIELDEADDYYNEICKIAKEV